MSSVWLLLLALCLALSSAGARADEVSIGVSFSIPPYVHEDGQSGLELDIVREALDYHGYRLDVRLLSQARTFKEFASGNLDGVLNVVPDTFPGAPVSDTVIHFQNYAIRLGHPPGKRARPAVADLANTRVTAFQNARHLLGAEFAAMANANPGYREIARQELQVKLLFAGRVDYVVMDGRIFSYYHEKLRAASATAPKETVAARVDYDRPVAFLPIFAASPYRIAFRDVRIRNDFNAGLKALQDSGRYQEIFDHYRSSRPDPFERLDAAGSTQ